MSVTSPLRRPVAQKPAGARVDPSPRSVSGSQGWMFGLEKADPDKHYVWAYNNDQVAGLEFYLQLGYDVVKWSDDPLACRPRGKKGQAGTDIQRQGHTLVAISREERDRMEQYGVDGDGGLAAADRMQQRIIQRQGVTRSLLGNLPGIRGRSGDPIMTVTNETSGLTSELEV